MKVFMLFGIWVLCSGLVYRERGEGRRMCMVVG